MHHQRGARLKCERRASLAPLIESHTTHDTTLSTFVARTHALAHPDVHTAHHALPTRRRATGAPSRFHWTGKAQFAPHTCRPRPPPRHHLARIVSAHACHDAARRFRRRKPQLGDCAGLARCCRPSTQEGKVAPGAIGKRVADGLLDGCHHRPSFANESQALLCAVQMHADDARARDGRGAHFERHRVAMRGELDRRRVGGGKRRPFLLVEVAARTRAVTPCCRPCLGPH